MLNQLELSANIPPNRPTVTIITTADATIHRLFFFYNSIFRFYFLSYNYFFKFCFVKRRLLRDDCWSSSWVYYDYDPPKDGGPDYPPGSYNVADFYNRSYFDAKLPYLVPALLLFIAIDF